MDTSTTETYGFKVGPSVYGPRGIVRGPEVTGTGNIVLRVGNELGGYDPTVNQFVGDSSHAWEQSCHVVLTPDEALTLAVGIIQGVRESTGTALRVSMQPV